MQQSGPRKGFMMPQKLVSYLNRTLKDRDVVFTPHNRFFWGLTWYLCGHGSLQNIYNDIMVCKVGEARVIVATAPFDPGYFHPGQEVWVTGPRGMSYLDGYEVLENGRYGGINLRKIKIPPVIQREVNGQSRQDVQ